MRTLILALLINLSISSADAATNLVQNGGFENGTMKYWTSSQQAGGKKRLFVISNKAKNGKFAVCNSGDLQNKYNGFITLVQTINSKIIHNKQYKLQGFIKADVKNIDGKSFAIAVRQVNAKDGSIVYTKIPVKLNINGWQYCIKQFSAHKQAVKFQLYLIATKLSSEDKIYIDDISLELIDSEKKKFNAAKLIKMKNKTELNGQDLSLIINNDTGLLHSLTSQKQIIHPGAKNVSCIYIEKDNKKFLFSRDKNTNIKHSQKSFKTKLIPESGELPFSASVEYNIKNGIVSEKVTFTANADINYPVKIGVRHGFDTMRWQRVFCAMRPLRIISSNAPTIFSYSSLSGDLNLTKLDQYQRTVYPFTIMENKDYFLWTGSGNLDNFVTVSPNYPVGYLPSVQQNPRKVKKGQEFKFELSWKLFSKKQNMMRDVWRWYSENTYSNNPLIKNYVPYKAHKFRTFYPGCFASSTYFKKDREARMFPNSNVWFYSWHDSISESYPSKGSWWLQGNSWKFKMTAPRLRTYVDRLQKDGHKLIFYLRQLANLRQRGKEKPESWYKRTAGGSLDLYGGGYEVKLPAHVAAEVGYKTIPWGTYDFDNAEFREHYIAEVKKVINFYNPAAIGWDMGWHPNHMGMFRVQAELFNWLRKTHPDKKVVSNESAGPTQFYSDMVLLENGLLGGKSKYDFEIAKGQNTSMVCLERWNLFRLAVKSNLTGCKTWLSPKGIAANKKYLDYLLKKNPNLKSNINEAARLCQLRMSLYDLAFGASPGYLEEAKPIPSALIKFSGDANGIPLISKSLMVKLPSGSDIDKDMAASVWADTKKFRMVIYNDSPDGREITLRLDRKYFEKIGWNSASLQNHAQFIVSPEAQETKKSFKINIDSNDLIFKGKLRGFSALMISKNK